MTSDDTTTQPRKRKGPGCLGIVALVIGALIVAFLVFAFTRPTDEQKIAKCPEVTRALISEQLGEPSSFGTTATYPGNQMKGTATVRGFVYEWICSVGITRGNRVQVDVRESDGSSVIFEYVDL